MWCVFELKKRAAIYGPRYESAIEYTNKKQWRRMRRLSSLGAKDGGELKKDKTRRKK